MVFSFLANELLDGVEDDETEFVWDGTNGIGFSWRENYSGTQARNPRSSQQGLFDIFVNTDGRYGHEAVTHRDILNDVLENCSLEQCRDVWSGGFPHEVADDDDQNDILSILALLMFEQEVNWGRKSQHPWQRYTPYFHPFVQRGREFERRPRDMLMAYIEWAFDDQSIDDLEFWITSRGSITLSPTNPSDRFETSQQLFSYRNGFGDDGGPPLMSGDDLDRFYDVADNFDDNPDYEED